MKKTFDGITVEITEAQTDNLMFNAALVTAEYLAKITGTDAEHILDCCAADAGCMKTFMDTMKTATPAIVREFGSLGYFDNIAVTAN